MSSSAILARLAQLHEQWCLLHEWPLHEQLGKLRAAWRDQLVKVG